MPATSELSVREASAQLYEAITHRVGPRDFGAGDPLVRSISEYGQRAREHDGEGLRAASLHVYEALTHHVGPRDLGAGDAFVRALTAYAEACRREGPKA